MSHRYAPFDSDGRRDRLRVTLRPALPSDAEAVRDIWRAAHIETRDVLDDIRRDLELTQGAPDRLVLVATAPQIVGYGRARNWPDDKSDPSTGCPAGWWLAGTVIAPEARRRGVGSALMRARLDALRGHDVHSTVDPVNRASMAWHRLNGGELLHDHCVCTPRRADDQPKALWVFRQSRG